MLKGLLFMFLNNFSDSEINFKGKLVKGSLTSLTVKGGYLFLQLFTGIYLARILGPQEYGSFAFAMAVVAVLSIPAELGFPGLLIRLTAIYNENHEYNLLKGLLLNALVIVLIASSIFVFIGFIVFRNEQIIKIIPNSPIYIAIFIVPIIALVTICESTLRGLGYFIIGQLPSQILRPALFLLIIIIISMRIDLNSEIAIRLNLFASILVLFFALWILKANISEIMLSIKPRYMTKTWLFMALPFLLLAGGQVINHHTDIVMVGVLLGGELTGQYRVAIQVADAMIMILTGITAVIAPNLATLYAKKDWRSIERILVFSHRVGVVILFPITMAIVFFSLPLIKLIFGVEYILAANALIILAIGKLLYATVGFSGIALSMFGYASTASAFTFLIIVLNVTMNFLLIPIYGIEGAAVATAVSAFIVNILMAFQIRKKISIKVTAFEFIGD